MSGLSKDNLKWKKTLYLGGAAFVLLIVVFFLSLALFPRVQNSQMSKEVHRIKGNIENIIINNDTSQINDDFTRLIQDSDVQLVILNDERTVFSNVPTNDFNVLKGFVKSDHVFYETQYNIPTNNGEYKVWFLMYSPVNNDVYFFIIILFTVILLLLSIIITLMVKASFTRVIDPLKRLQNNIAKLRNYQLNDIDISNQDKYDLYSAEIMDFSTDLQDRFDTFGATYTTLEKDLRISEETNVYKQQLISSLIHDLKTPLNISNLYLEKLSKNQQPSKELVSIEKNNIKVLTDINEILKIVYDDKNEFDITESVDVIFEIKNLLRMFDGLFNECNLSFSIDMISTKTIELNRLEFKSVLHNALINVVHYAKRETIFNVEAYQETNNFIIKISNEVDDVSKIDFDHIFDLFYSSHQENSYGSGIGMYVIKSILNRMNGDCFFYEKDGGVELMIQLNLEGREQ